MEDIDQMTVKAAIRGDKKAFRRLYDHYAPFVWRIACKTAGPTTAEEIVQETFVRIHRSLNSFAGSSSLGTWIYRIAFNMTNTIVSSRLRSRDRHTSLPENLASHQFPANRYDADELVEKIMATLSSEERFLLVAREVDGLSYEEIAGITGKSQESLRTRLSRLKDRIAAEFRTEPLEAAV